MDDIEKNLKFMKKEKEHLKVREGVMRRELNKILANKEGLEGSEASFDIVQIAVDELKELIDSFDDEILKISWGMEQLAVLEESDAKETLRKYIEKDTNLSIRNFGTSRETYDSIIKSLKEIEGLFEE